MYLTDAELEQLGYTKEGLIWIIGGQSYRLKEATATGFYFVKVKSRG